MQLVVGAVIVDSLDRPTTVVAARRTRPAELAGLWEFPGGKVEPGEEPRAALVREIREELGATVRLGDVLGDEDWPISEQHVLRLHLAVVTDGVLTCDADHDALRTLTASELDSVPWLPSDRAAIPVLAGLLRSPGLGSRPTQR